MSASGMTGLLNILKDADEVKAKNGSFFVSLGYNF